MAPLVTRHLPLVAADDLYEFVGTGDPSDSPGVPAAVGSRFIRTDGASGTVEYHKFGAADTDWEATAGGGGGGSGVSSVTGTAPITASPTSGAVVVSHDVSGVTAGTYGDDVTVAVVTVDVTGHVTEVVETPITFPAESDPGVATGTPGNWTWTLQTTPPVVVRNVGANAVEPPAFKAFRKYHNTNTTAKLRIQPANHVASGADVEACLMYSLDGGATPLVEAGPTVRLDRVNYPEPGAYTALDPLAVGPNVLLGLGLKGGDGTDRVKIGNIVVDSVSSDAPPASPSGDPPAPSSLPQGGALGNLILDLDTQGALMTALAYADAAAVTSWPDETTITGDAAPYTTASTQSAPVYHTSGLAGGSMPRVQVAGSNHGVAINVPTQGECTFYFVVGGITGYGTQGDGSNFTDGPMLVSGGGTSHNNGWVSVRADGKIQAGVDSGPFGNPSKMGSANISGAGPHLVRFAWFQPGGSFSVFVDGVLDLTLSDALATNIWTFPRFYLGNFTGADGTIAIDFGRVVCYDAAYTTAGLNAVELILQAAWSTP